MKNMGISNKLKFADLAPDVWKKLGEMPRTGWVYREVSNPETVQEHTVACRDFVVKNQTKLTDFSITELQDVLDMLEVHDWAESITGDEVVPETTEEEENKIRAAKFEREHNAMIEICKKMQEKGDVVMDLWLRFEKKDSKAAKFAREVDKYQAGEKAFEYERIGNGWKTIAEEFIRSARKHVFHPLLISRLDSFEAQMNGVKI